MVGLTAAKALAFALEIPLVAVDHLEGHLYACQLAYPEREVYPCLGLVVSGGHTSIYRCESPIQSEFLGGTADDAAGEAFDKVASLLGLGYPGGPEIERAARGGNPAAFAFPRSFVHDERLLLSFSGLKTAVRYALHGQNDSAVVREPSAQLISEWQPAFRRPWSMRSLPRRGGRLARTGMKRLSVGGGVAANTRLRQKLADMTAGAKSSYSFHRSTCAPTTRPWPQSRSQARGWTNREPGRRRDRRGGAPGRPLC